MRLLLKLAVIMFYSLVGGTVNAQVGQPIAVLHTQPYIYTINPSGTIYVNYRFKASAPTAVSNSVFVHFIDASGNIVYQADHTPPISTTQWAGDIVYEKVITFPASLAAGRYTIAIGLYVPSTGARTALTTVVNSTSVDPTYTYEDAPNSKRYVVGEVYITNKQIVDAPFACNGTNVTAALAQALYNLSAGQVLKLPFGTCYYANFNQANALRLDGKTNVEVVGQGAPSTMLITVAPATDPTARLHSAFVVAGSSTVLLRDFKIEVSRTAGNAERTGNPEAAGIYVENSSFVELRQLAIASPLAQGIGFYKVNDSSANRNFVKLSAADGIHIAGPSSNITLDTNETFDVGDDGLSSIGYATGQFAGLNQNITIQNNRVRFQDIKWGSGIAVEGTLGARVLNNYVTKSGSAGIRIASLDGIQIIGGISYPFQTGAVSSVEVTNNQLVEVETRTDLDHGAIHIAAEYADISGALVSGNSITSSSSIGTATDAIRVVGKVRPAGTIYVRDSNVWNNAISNTSPGVLGNWCVGRSTSTTVNLVLNKNPQGQTLKNKYNGLSCGTPRSL